MDETEAQYEYHLGDSVYIGASQYEILSFDENRVMLYDFDMPLFNKELPREEFDRKVRENPMNDHLKAVSYTHLDLYKRQYLRRSGSRRDGNCNQRRKRETKGYGKS